VIGSATAHPGEEGPRRGLAQHGASLVEIDRPGTEARLLHHLDEEAADADQHEAAEPGLAADTENKLDTRPRHRLEIDLRARLGMLCQPGGDLCKGGCERRLVREADAYQAKIALMWQLRCRALEHDRIAEPLRHGRSVP